MCVDEEPNPFWVSLHITCFCPAHTCELKPRKTFGNQNYGSKTPCLSMPTVHRAHKSFPWHSCEHSLQTPSISMDQNPHRRPTGERALTFSQHVVSATDAQQRNRNNTGSWQKVCQFQVTSTVLYWCSAATATTKHDCHKDAQVHSWRLLFQGQKPAWNPAPAKVSWSFRTDLTESACHLEHLLCHRVAWRIRSFKPLPSLQTSFSKKVEAGSGRTAAAACSWRSHTAILHSVHWQTT